MYIDDNYHLRCIYNTIIFVSTMSIPPWTEIWNLFVRDTDWWTRDKDKDLNEPAELIDSKFNSWERKTWGRSPLLMTCFPVMVFRSPVLLKHTLLICFRLLFKWPINCSFNLADVLFSIPLTAIYSDRADEKTCFVIPLYQIQSPKI